ncbi:MAG: protein phosphatase 2C domain-containing protein [Myxococcaceae bacterium]|nr:protein phosphatase 2C domain-containing protein [Myxococcaceae bacterium]
MSAATVTQARTATVTGREHVRLGRNNQDGVFVASRDGACVAVVTDGCSSEPFSEVGARLGARALATMTATLGHVPLAALPAVAFDHLSTWLSALVRSVEADDARAVLSGYGLFTVLCVVQRGPEAVVFGSGDGAVFVDGALTRLSSGDDNAPAYPGYRLLGREVPPVTHHLGPARRVALCTDGLDGFVAAGGVGPLFDDALVWRNPAHLQRQLNVLHARERFADDATLALLATEAQ